MKSPDDGRASPELPPWYWQLRADVGFGLDQLATRTAGYAARMEWQRLLQNIPDRHRLEHHGRKIYSQNDEDGIIEEIFRRLGLSSCSGQFVEIGVGNGLECNTHYLLHCGFAGVWLEGAEDGEPQIRERFRSPLEKGTLRLAHAFITADNINPLLKANLRASADTVLLSIDIDGNDFWIWKVIDVITPAVVVIEYNAKFPPPVSLVQEYRSDFTWSGTDYFGASLEALVTLGNGKGYRLVACNITGSNAFFVRKDLLGGHFPYDLTTSNLYHPCRYHLTDDCFRRCGHPPDFGNYVRIE